MRGKSFAKSRARAAAVKVLPVRRVVGVAAVAAVAKAALPKRTKSKSDFTLAFFLWLCYNEKKEHKGL